MDSSSPVSGSSIFFTTSFSSPSISSNFLVMEHLLDPRLRPAPGHPEPDPVVLPQIPGRSHRPPLLLGDAVAPGEDGERAATLEERLLPLEPRPQPPDLCRDHPVQVLLEPGHELPVLVDPPHEPPRLEPEPEVLDEKAGVLDLFSERGPHPVQVACELPAQFGPVGHDELGGRRGGGGPPVRGEIGEDMV